MKNAAAQPPETTGGEQNPLMTRITAGKTPDARLHTFMSAWLKGIQAANRDGTQNPNVNTWIQTETGRVDAYCGAILATSASQTTGAGGRTGG